MKAMGVVLTQPLSFPRNSRAILLALPRNSSLLVCVEGGQGWDWCQLGGGYLDSKGLLSVLRTQVPPAPTLMHASQVPPKGGYVGGWVRAR